MPWEDIDDALKSLVKSVQGKREEWGMKTGMKASGVRWNLAFCSCAACSECTRGSPAPGLARPRAEG